MRLSITVDPASSLAAGYEPVDPNAPQAATEGTVSVVSSGWLEASHEVAFLFYEGSFERQVPAV